MKDTRPFCIYLRKSREDKEIEKYENLDTLAKHRKALLKYAQEHNMIIGHIYEEIVSGETIAERKVMQDLLSDVEKRMWQGVLVIEVERLARGDTSDQGIVASVFKYSSTKIVTLTKIYDPNNEFDEEYFEFGLYMSRREYKTINRRLQRGKESSIKDGKYVGNIPPFGYKIKKLENTNGFSLEPDLEEMNIVKIIFNLSAYKGFSATKIANTLDSLGVKPRKSDYWSSSTIKEILSNPVYIGKIRWNARKHEISTKNGKRIKSRPRNHNALIVEGLHPAIIDEKTWNTVQLKKGSHLPPISNKSVIKNSLAGIVYCEKCGKLMQRRTYSSQLQKPTLICTNPRCDNISSKLYLIENKIIQALKIWFKNYKIDYEKLFRQNNPTTIIALKKELLQLKNRLHTEKSKVNKIYDYLEDGIYNKKEFIERLSVSQNKIKDLKHTISKLELSIINEEQNNKEGTIVIPKIENVIDIYDNLKNNKNKNIFLKNILKKVTYLKTEKSIKKISNPTNFEIHIYPRIQKLE